ncbi:MAG: hypothetical protein MUO82_09620 [Candidatus Thermoplasmatota archaeon]|nr:hypothetical protein [Candidatus Thermoplasmatota archaeon]
MSYFQIAETDFKLRIQDVFFLVFFAFIIKSSVDFYNLFIKSQEVTYALSTHINHKKTITEIFFAVFLTNIFIWFSFSTLYIIGLIIFGININYPDLYLFFNLGVISAICLGCSICINFFSRLRVIPMAILFIFYFYFQEPLFVVMTLPLAVLYILWSINHAKESHQNIRRKERINNTSQNKTRSIIWAIFHKETTILWRDRLLASFISTSAFTGLGAGYLYLHGDELFIPTSLRFMYGEFLPSMFIFLGIFIVVIYTAVFPSLILFLNEEKTLWIIRHIPIKNEKLILGKISSLILCFIAGIPFIPFMLIFVGFENLLYICWFLVFAYLASVIIALPIGVKYVGKKSDIMLLYSVTMLLLFVLGIGSFISVYIWTNMPYPIVPSMLIILVEFVALYVSVKISDKILTLRKPLSLDLNNP